MDAHSQEDLLADAAREGEAPKLRHLLRKLSPDTVGAPFSRPQCRCWPCAPAPVIIHAALGGHAGIIAQLLHAGADPDVRDGDGWTALMYAAHARDAACVREMLRSDCDMDAANACGDTALILAAKAGRVECARLLVASRCDRLARDHAGKTALDWAQERGANAELMELIEKPPPARPRRERLGKDLGMLGPSPVAGSDEEKRLDADWDQLRLVLSDQGQGSANADANSVETRDGAVLTLVRNGATFYLSTAASGRVRVLRKDSDNWAKFKAAGTFGQDSWEKVRSKLGSEFGARNREVDGFVAHSNSDTCVVRYKYDNQVECWNWRKRLPVWRRRLKGEITAMRILRSDDVVAGSAGGDVVLLSPSGEPEWKSNLERQINALQVTPSDEVVAGSESGQIARWNDEGDLVWKRQLKGAITAIQSTSAGGIVAGSSRGDVVVWSSSGREVWRWKTGESVFLEAFDMVFGGGLEAEIEQMALHARVSSEA